MGAALSARSRILTGPIPSEVLRFGAPIAIGMGFQTTFNLVDAYVISRLEPAVASPALGALGICDQLSAIGTIFSYGLTTASAALIAQAYGRRDTAAIRKLVWQSILAVGALSLIFGLVSIAFAGPILATVVGAKGQVASLGASYLRVNSGGAFSIFFLLQLTAIQRALGSSKTPMALMVLSNVLNLFFAVILVYGPGPAPAVFSWGPPIAAALHLPRMELLGAAWATVIARTIALVPVVILLIKRFDVFDRVSRTGPDREVLGSIWTIAWPSSTQFVVRMVAMLLTQSLVARAFTTPEDQSATTALGIVFRLETMALFVAMGWGGAAQTFVGQNLGAGYVARARQAGWCAAAYNAALMLAIAVAFQRAALPIITFFDEEPEVVAIAVRYVHIIAWSYLGLGTGVVLGNAITGSGATRTPLVTDLAVIVGFQLPASVLAAALAGGSLDRLWGAVAATYAISGVIYLVVFRFASWTRVPASRRPEVDVGVGPPSR
jgi:putative MATE family efflux protein